MFQYIEDHLYWDEALCDIQNQEPQDDVHIEVDEEQQPKMNQSIIETTFNIESRKGTVTTPRFINNNWGMFPHFCTILFSNTV